MFATSANPLKTMAAGFEVAAIRTLHLPDATASANISLVEECRAYAIECELQADTVLIPDTAVNSLSTMPALETAVGKSVLTVNQACLFEGATLVGKAAYLTEYSAFTRFEGCSEEKIL